MRVQSHTGTCAEVPTTSPPAHLRLASVARTKSTALDLNVPHTSRRAAGSFRVFTPVVRSGPIGRALGLESSLFSCLCSTPLSSHSVVEEGRDDLLRAMSTHAENAFLHAAVRGLQDCRVPEIIMH